ncbi:MAG: ATP-binding protein [Peptoniphilaceae bacterium]|nr:ATP-binding protein [Peptoniphilaceae bacterium]MDY5765534.1 ATP-binding protein [Peptoniphilaceae bacterium]
MRPSASEILAGRRQRAERLRDQRVQRLEKMYPEIARSRKALMEQGRNLMQVALRGSKKEIADLRAGIDAARRHLDEEMRRAGLSPSDFEPEYQCPDCKDTGFVEGKSCHCRNKLLLEQKYELSSVSRLLEQQNFQTFDLSLFRKDRQPGEEVSPYEHMADLKKILFEYVETFSAKSPNLYFYGPTGTGKTFLVNCIAKEVLDRGFTVYYQMASEIADFLVSYSFMFEADRRSVTERREFIFSCDLLIIDDFGTEFPNDKTRSELFSLINERILRQKPTVISSNISPEEIREHYDERIESRIAGEYELFELYGSDLRRRF